MQRGRGFLTFLRVTGSLNGLTRGPRRLRLAKGLLGKRERPPLLCREQRPAGREEPAVESEAERPAEPAAGLRSRPRLPGRPEPRFRRTIIPQRRRSDEGQSPAGDLGQGTGETAGDAGAAEGPGSSEEEGR